MAQGIELDDCRATEEQSDLKLTLMCMSYGNISSEGPETDEALGVRREGFANGCDGCCLYNLRWRIRVLPNDGDWFDTVPPRFLEGSTSVKE